MPGPNREIHRPLSLVTPNLKGPDVEELQQSINRVFSTFKLPNRVDTDGEFGPQTKRRANRVLYLLGVSPKGEGPAGPLFTQAEQKAIRQPDSRTKEQKERSERRVADAVKAASQSESGAAAAVKWALAQKGTLEQPPGSNWGGKVEEWIRFCGFGFPVFWCGCFCAVAAMREGKAKVKFPTVLTHNVEMLRYADSGGYGVDRVSISEARAGDIVSFTFAHIGMLVEPISGGRLHTIEGNTSATGQANNGGGVYEHTDRTISLVQGIVRPDYS